MSDYIESYRSAREDFRHARREAAIQGIVARFTGKSTELLSYEEVSQKLKAVGSADRGLKEILIEKIIGSVGRYTDFTRSFLPRHDSDESRWAHVMSAMTNVRAQGLPPIEVYQLGDVYFVKDGHHRVSIAKQLGVNSIEAYVTEVRTKVPLTSDVQPDDLIVKAEYAEFLERTRIEQSRHVDLNTTVPGQYEKLQEQIELYRRRIKQKENRELTLEEAASRWCDDWYLPLIEVIREQGILRDFPDRTEADMYLWVLEHREAIQEELGWRVRPEAAAKNIADQKGTEVGEWRKEKLKARYSDYLIADVLVPLSGEDESWYALEQALIIAKREESRLYGLHVVGSEALKESDSARAIKQKFEERCAAAGVRGSLAIESGEIANKICERASLTDLIVINLAHPPSAQLFSKLASGFRTLIHRSPRPILAVPAPATELMRPLLAYSADSPKAEEALFAATYIAETWKARLMIVSVIENDSDRHELDRVRDYLEFHEVSADFILEKGSPSEVILQTAEKNQNDLIIMGGYGSGPVMEAVRWSSLDVVLRGAKVAMMLCR
ncbi:MAG: universal stress protein [Chloroflexi bacterium]|nr:universal stress protein [Chloroflexota bacterium]